MGQPQLIPLLFNIEPFFQQKKKQYELKSLVMVSLRVCAACVCLILLTDCGESLTTLRQLKTQQSLFTAAGRFTEDYRTNRKKRIPLISMAG